MRSVMIVISIVLALLCCYPIVKELVWNKIAPVKSVKATVVDKYKPNTVSRYPGVFKSERYIIVFETKDKRLSFAVSEFSHSGYRLKEKGTLKYKGTRIISFK